jgi:hypothetical protein
MAMLGLAPAIASATPLATATLTISSPDLAVAPMTFPGVGATGSAPGPGLATIGGGSAFAGTATRPVLPIWPGLDELRVQVLANQFGTFAGSPLSGNAVFEASANFLYLGVPFGPPIPLRFGATSRLPAKISLPTFGSHLSLFVDAEPWAALANDLTANGRGTVQLFSPITVEVPGLPSFRPQILAQLDLIFVPEPGTALLLGWGVVCLAIAGRRRSS